MISSAKVPTVRPTPNRSPSSPPAALEDLRSSDRWLAAARPLAPPQCRAGGLGSTRSVVLPIECATPEREPGAKGAKPLAPLPELNLVPFL